VSSSLSRAVGSLGGGSGSGGGGAGAGAGVDLDPHIVIISHLDHQALNRMFRCHCEAHPIAAAQPGCHARLLELRAQRLIEVRRFLVLANSDL